MALDRGMGFGLSVLNRVYKFKQVFSDEQSPGWEGEEGGGDYMF